MRFNTKKILFSVGIVMLERKQISEIKIKGVYKLVGVEIGKKGRMKNSAGICTLD